MTSDLVWDLVFVFENLSCPVELRFWGQHSVPASSWGKRPGVARTSVVPRRGLAFPVPTKQCFNLVNRYVSIHCLLYAKDSS